MYLLPVTSMDRDKKYQRIKADIKGTVRLSHEHDWAFDDK